jgi:hypothetical protein
VLTGAGVLNRYKNGPFVVARLSEGGDLVASVTPAAAQRRELEAETKKVRTQRPDEAVRLGPPMPRPKRYPQRAQVRRQTRGLPSTVSRQIRHSAES